MEFVWMERDEPFIPQEVVEFVIRQDMPLVKAWRLHKGFSIEEAAARAGLRVYEAVQLESADNQPSSELEKMASGMGLDLDQVVDL